MYKFSLLNNSFRSISKTEVTAAVAPHLHEAIGFAANPEYEDVLMYATENAVYSFAVNQLECFYKFIIGSSAKGYAGHRKYAGNRYTVCGYYGAGSY